MRVVQPLGAGYDVDGAMKQKGEEDSYNDIQISR